MAFIRLFPLTSSSIFIIFLLTDHIPNIVTSDVHTKSLNIDNELFTRPSLLNVSLPEKIFSGVHRLSAFHVEKNDLYIFATNVLFHYRTQKNSSGGPEFNLIAQVDIR